jgi:hypothetical protein
MESAGELLQRARGLLPPLQGGAEDLLLPLYQVRPYPGHRGHQEAPGGAPCAAAPIAGPAGPRPGLGQAGRVARARAPGEQLRSAGRATAGIGPRPILTSAAPPPPPPPPPPQGVLLLVLRVSVERLALSRLRAALKVHSYGAARGAEKRAREVIEQAFCAALIAPLTAWGWWVMLRHNGPCTPLQPKGCLVGWPNHPVSPQFRWWWLTIGGMYTGEIIGTLLGGVGFRLSKEMMAHHVITLVLMYFGYFRGLHRYGQMATTVLDTSNAFLHFAKAVHASGLPQLAPAKDALFKLFACVFLVCRVMLPPFCMLVPGIVYARAARMPLAMYLVTNGLMCSVYGLQLMWLSKIVKIAAGGTDKRVGTYTPTPGATPVTGSPAGSRRATKQD